MVLNRGWTGWKNCEVFPLFLLQYFHTLIYFGQIFTEFDQFDKNFGFGPLLNKSC
jgi:hypothetical protein